MKQGAGEEPWSITAIGLSIILLIAGENIVIIFSSHTHIILFRSIEQERNWEIVFDFIFSEEGLINQSYFITKHIGKLSQIDRLSLYKNP
jgi:hypothetical protein